MNIRFSSGRENNWNNMDGKLKTYCYIVWVSKKQRAVAFLLKMYFDEEVSSCLKKLFLSRGSEKKKLLNKKVFFSFNH